MKDSSKTKNQLINELTELRKMLSGLERSEGASDRYKNDLPLCKDILDQTNDAIFLVDSETSQLIDVNERACDNLGYSREELLKMRVVDIEAVLPNNFSWKEHVKEIKKLGGAVLEGKHKRKDGTVFPIEASVRYLSQGNSQYIVAVVRDITERKRAEEALREAEEKFRTIFESSNDAITIIGESGVIDFNDAALRMMGYSNREGLVGTNPGDWSPPAQPDGRDSTEAAKYEVAKAFKEGGNFFEWTHRRADGELFQAEVLLTPMQLDGVQVLQSTVRDITDRKRAEEALRKSEEKFRNITETTTDSIYQFDTAGNVIFMNDAGARMYGYKREEIEGMNFSVLLDEARLPEALELVEKVLSGESIQGEFYVRHKDRHEFPIFYSMVPIINNNTVVGFTGISRDISESKKAEEELKDSERRLKLAQSIGAIGDWEFDVDTQEIIWSEQLFNLYERDPSLNTPNLEEIMDLYDPEVSIKLTEKWLRAIELGEAYNIDYPIKLPSGKFVYHRGQVRVNKDENDRVIKLYGTVQDITERKAAEEKLRGERERLYSILEAFPGFVYLQAPDYSIRFANKRFIDYYGDPNGKKCHELIWDRDKPCDECPTFEVFDTKEPVEWISDHKSQDRVYQVYDYPFIDIDGTFLVLEISIDITKRKRSEAELERSREKLRNLTLHLQSKQEQERARIARDIHDDLGQLLTALEFDTAYMAKQLLPEQKELIEKAKKMSELIMVSTDTVQRIASELRPALLDDLGLVAAMEWQAEQFNSHTGLECEVMFDSNIEIFDRNLSTALFRAFQEALTNIARHSNATSVCASLKQDSRGLILKISDNGKGIRSEDISKKESFGLSGMKERFIPFGGNMKIEGIKDKGTTICITVPLKGDQ